MSRTSLDTWKCTTKGRYVTWLKAEDHVCGRISRQDIAVMADPLLSVSLERRARASGVAQPRTISSLWLFAKPAKLMKKKHDFFFWTGVRATVSNVIVLRRYARSLCRARREVLHQNGHFAGLLIPLICCKALALLEIKLFFLHSKVICCLMRQLKGIGLYPD